MTVPMVDKRDEKEDEKVEKSVDKFCSNVDKWKTS